MMYCEARREPEQSLDDIEQYCDCEDCKEFRIPDESIMTPYVTLESIPKVEDHKPNYNFMRLVLYDFLRRSRREKMYYIVCNAFNEHYDKKPEWYKSLSWYKNVRKFLLRDDPDLDYLFVKEQDAAKHHLNFLVVSDFDFTKYHGKNRYHCKWDVQEIAVGNETGRLVCGTYMIKESKTRKFLENVDYVDTMAERFNRYVAKLKE